MNKFSSLAVKAPAKLEDIPATIATLNEKIAYYEELPPPEIEDFQDAPEEFKKEDTLFEDENSGSFPEPLQSRA